MTRPDDTDAIGRLRVRAERLLDERLRDAGPSVPTEVRELIHELGVHQVELELQNEELRRAQLDLAETRDRYRDLYEFAPVGYLTLEYDTTVRDANLAVCLLVGIERQRLVGQTLSRMLTSSDREVLFAHRDEVLGTGRAACEITLHPPGGPGLVVRLQSNADAAATPRPRPWRTTLIDLTTLRDAEREVSRLNRKLAERVEAQAVALRFQEDEFRVLVDHVPALFAFVGPDQRYRFVNQRDVEQFGDAAPASVGQHVRDLLGSDDYETARPHIEAALDGRLVTYEATFSFGRSDSRRLLVTYVPNFDAAGAPNGFFSIATDVTGKREAERALAENEKQLRAVLGTVGDAIITLDESGTIVTANRATERIFGYHETELIGQDVRLLVPRLDLLKAFVKSEGHDHQREPIELWARTRAGRTFPVEVTVNVIDHLLRYVAILRDISERKEMERHLAEIASRERQALAQELHDDLAGRLSGIEMFADTIRRRLARDDSPHVATMKELVEHVSECRARMRSVARGLLPLEISEHGLLEALEELALRTEEMSGVTCSVVGDSSVSIPDLTIATHLYRIVQEAVTNAVRHGQPEAISIGLQASPAGIEVTVLDDGVGLDPGLTPRTGLRTMQYRARSIGARLHYEGQPGRGTTVRCVLPRDHLREPAVAPI